MNIDDSVKMLIEEARVGAPWTQDGKKMVARLEAFCTTFKNQCVREGASAMLQRMREGMPEKEKDFVGDIFSQIGFPVPSTPTLTELLDVEKAKKHNACREIILSLLDTLQKEIEGTITPSEEKV